MKELRFHYGQEMPRPPLTLPSSAAIVCIGTDRSTGDSLGPLVGTMLRRRGATGVYGTLRDPVDATNLPGVLEEIGAGRFILAIDAMLGSSTRIGEIALRPGPVHPGRGMKKELPPTGDAHIVGHVNVGGFRDFFVLQNTRLSLVVDMAARIADLRDGSGGGGVMVGGTDTVRHPAKYSDALIPCFARLLEGTESVLDPMAGTGKLMQLREHGYAGAIYLNELEPEWARQAPKGAVVTTCDAEHLPYEDGFFDAVCTSPTYGNRMADHHDAKDGSKRNTYRHTLGRKLTPGNTGQMQWGEAYRDKHWRIWAECKRVLKPDGLLVLNISDHIRAGEVVPVTQWHKECLIALGFTWVGHAKIPTPRLRYGANHNARVAHEWVLAFRKEDAQ